MKGKQRGGVSVALGRLLEGVRRAFGGPTPVLRPIPVRPRAVARRPD
jgi:hypothetical protein